MKRNDKALLETKQKIQQIINTMPDQFSLSTAKSYLRNAILAIENVEVKRKKREEINQQQQQMIAFTSYESAKNALDILDNMLEAEKKNLEKAETPQNNELLNG